MKSNFDCIIIGGGPAGLSAGIYLSRFNRKVLIIDKESGRWDTLEKNENYLGFPEGIHARQLRQLGKQQAINFGTEFIHEEVSEIIKITQDKPGLEDISFEVEVKTKTNVYTSRSILLATGVKDILPAIPDVEKYLGKSLFWCITCDGWKTIEKSIAIIGQDNDAVVTCLQFLNFTKDIKFITNTDPNDHSISQEYIDRLNKHNIPFIEGIVKKFNGDNGLISSVELNNQLVQTNFVFSSQGAVPNNELAKKLEVDIDQNGYIKTDTEQRTNIKFVYAAGDLTKLFAHQIVTAAHEGATAACAINYDLYLPDQQV